MNKLLFPILSIIAAVGLYFLYIGPTYEDIQAHQAKEAEFQNAFVEIGKVRNRLEELEAEFTSISREDLLRLEIFLPSEIDLPRVAQNFEKLLEDNNIRAGGVSILPASGLTDGGVAQIRMHKVDIDIDVLYQDFLDILSDIEGSLQHASISSISFGAEAELKRADDDEGEFVSTSTPYGIGLTIYSFE